MFHSNADECVTGRRAYDLHTLLLLTRPVHHEWPDGDILHVTCSGRPPDTLVRLYSLDGSVLLLARHVSHRRSVARVPTYTQDLRIPVMLKDAPPLRLEMRCRCSRSVTSGEVCDQVAAALATRRHTVSI